MMAGLALVALGSCSNTDYTEKYSDPSKTNTVSVPDVFTAVLVKGNTWLNPVYYRYYCQTQTSGVFGGMIGSSNGKGRFMGGGEGRFNDRWTNFYDMLTQYRVLEKTYNKLDESEQSANKVYLMVSRSILESQLHEMLSLFGAVPFKGAGTLWENSDYTGAKQKAAYDDDADLYKMILADLKEAGDYFAEGGPSTAVQNAMASKDYTIAAGNAARWQKYINSLRLRIALHLSTNGSVTSEAHAAIKEIVENPTKYPVIESNADNMGVEPSTNSDDFNWGKSISQALWTGYTPSQAMLDALNVPANGIPTADTDPRIQVMLDPNPDGEYISYDVTKTNSEISDIATEKGKDYQKRKLYPANYYCVLDSQAVAGWKEYEGNSNVFGLWMGAAEVSLSKSEAYLMGYGVTKDEAKAKACFIKGVELSTEYFWNEKKNSSLYKKGNDSYNANRDLIEPTAEETAAYAEKAWKPTQEAVCTQLWLNFGWTNLLEAWNVTRRTGYPEVSFAKDNQLASYPTPPGRLPYPSDELNYNKDNVQAAISKYYKEPLGYFSTLFWAKDVYYKIVAEH